MKNQRRRKIFRSWIVFLVVVSLAASAAFFVYGRKDAIRQHFSTYLTERVWNLFNLQVSFDSIGGNVIGELSFSGIQAIYISGDTETKVFEADDVTFKYRIFDFLMERFTGNVEIDLNKPIFYADVPFVADTKDGHNVEIFTKFLVQAQDRIKLNIKDGSIAWKGQEDMFSGIEGSIQNQKFDLWVQLNHIILGENDISTQLFVKGQLDHGYIEGEERLKGFSQTRGTVVNYKPIARESYVTFTLTKDRLIIDEAILVGGLELEGDVKYHGKPEVNLNLQSKAYPLKYFNNFFRFTPESELSGLADINLSVSGHVFTPMMQGQITIKESNMGGDPFTNMQLNVSGVYPEVRLSESRVVTIDGTAMNFANQSLHITELFDYKTYERLVSRRDQDKVIWGDWKLKRVDTSESVMLEREVSDLMKVKYERYDYDESQIRPDETENEVGVEVSLTDEDVFKMSLTEDEEFVGLERKMSF